MGVCATYRVLSTLWVCSAFGLYPTPAHTQVAQAVRRLLMTAKILEGNVLETLKDVPPCSVQCVVTSPPYYCLRDYGVEGQIGNEKRLTNT